MVEKPAPMPTVRELRYHNIGDKVRATPFSDRTLGPADG